MRWSCSLVASLVVSRQASYLVLEGHSALLAAQVEPLDEGDRLRSALAPARSSLRGEGERRYLELRKPAMMVRVLWLVSDRFARPQCCQLCGTDVAAAADDRHLPAGESLA